MATPNIDLETLHLPQLTKLFLLKLGAETDRINFEKQEIENKQREFNSFFNQLKLKEKALEQTRNDLYEKTQNANNLELSLKARELELNSLISDLSRQTNLSNTVRSLSTNTNGSDVIKLNISGTCVSVQRSTLTYCKDSLLEILFNGKNNNDFVSDEKGYYFLDYNPTLFVKILDIIRMKRFENNTSQSFLLPFPRINADQVSDMKALISHLRLDKYFTESNYYDTPSSTSTVAKDSNLCSRCRSSAAVQDFSPQRSRNDNYSPAPHTSFNAFEEHSPNKIKSTQAPSISRLEQKMPILNTPSRPIPIDNENNLPLSIYKFTNRSPNLKVSEDMSTVIHTDKENAFAPIIAIPSITSDACWKITSLSFSLITDWILIGIIGNQEPALGAKCKFDKTCFAFGGSGQVYQYGKLVSTDNWKGWKNVSTSTFSYNGNNNSLKLITYNSTGTEISCVEINNLPSIALHIFACLYSKEDSIQILGV